MRVAIVENMKDTQLGALGTALAEAAAEIEWFHPWNGDRLPQGIFGHDALIVLGGEQSALDDGLHPYLGELARLMRRFGDAGKAVLGICLGSQILARGYGADNLLGAAPEFGWRQVEVTEEGRNDPLLSAVSEGFPIFQWHSDTFSLPAEAVRLASNGAAVNQCFRVGRAAYGTQFHFEADTSVVEHWKAGFAPAIERIAPGWLADYPAIAEENAALADRAGLAIARAWVAQIVVGSVAPAAAAS